MINSAEFTGRLQKVIDYYNESASSFAEKIGVQRSSISHILSGRNKPSLEFVLKVLSSFEEVELYWLMNGKGEFPKSETKNRQTPIAPISKNEDQDLFSNTKNENPVETKNSDLLQNLNQKSSNGKIIERIVIFYSDGSFSNFENS